MSKSRALLAATAGLLVAGVYLLHATLDATPPRAPETDRAAHAAARAAVPWSALPTETPTPPASAKGAPPPRLGDVPGASPPLPAQPDVATIRANLDRAAAKAVLP